MVFSYGFPFPHPHRFNISDSGRLLDLQADAIELFPEFVPLRVLEKVHNTGQFFPSRPVGV